MGAGYIYPYLYKTQRIIQSFCLMLAQSFKRNICLINTFVIMSNTHEYVNLAVAIE